MIATSTARLLPPAVWQAVQRAHEDRVDELVQGHRERATSGKRHPVEDFLFRYYSFRPAALRHWHPGPGVVLAGQAAHAFLRWPGYKETEGGITLNIEQLPTKRREFARWLAQFLAATAARPAFFGCFGWHEWAMVYRQSADQVRHNSYPLRFPAEELATMVEQGSGCCTHFDAFRFFTPPARPLNRHQPTRETTIELEQPGCLHANMDLYKWAYKLSPAVSSDLLLRCFELAHDIREVDMRASPYDLRELGYDPIKIETSEGRAEYEKLQRGFAERAAPLRAELRNAAEVVAAIENGNGRG